MRLNVHKRLATQSKASRTESRTRVVFLASLAVFAALFFTPRGADACEVPANGFFEPDLSKQEQDTTLPVLNSISSVVSPDDDGDGWVCDACAVGGYWILSVDGEDSGETGTASAPALGYRIEVLSGTVYLVDGFPLLEADRFSEDALPVVYLYGDIDKAATIRITPIDRAGNAGEPIEHRLEAFVERGGACSTQGRSSGLGMLLLLAAILVGLRPKHPLD